MSKKGDEETAVTLDEIAERLDALEEKVGQIVEILGQNPDHKEVLK